MLTHKEEQMEHSKIPDVWKNHPELQDGEVFLTNASDDDWDRISDDPHSSWESIGWKTKRMGNVAYDIIEGKPVPGMFPVFVQKRELMEAGIDTDTLWWAK
ncbi:MAG: hypothetical protein Q7R91_01055 [bacterium]|nr:hypothetical protein [bacterium]